jgi:hypothetical protein
MPYTTTDIINKVKSLNLPVGQYMLIGGSNLAVRGFRDTRDLDILVTPDLFNTLMSDGFVLDPEYEQKWNRKRLIKDDTEIYGDLYLEKQNYFFDVAQIISEADIVEGIPVQSLQNILVCKADSAREKDLRDIELIKEYLKERFKKDGYLHIFEWTDAPNTIYEEHEHKGRTAFYILRGAVTFTSGFDKTFTVGERFDVPPGIKHTAIVGPEGCDWIVAEDIEGDS